MKSILLFFINRIFLLTLLAIILHCQVRAQSIDDVSPSEACFGDTITVIGTNLDVVESAKIGGKNTTIIDGTRTNTSFQVTIPNNLAFPANDQASPKLFNVVGVADPDNLVLRNKLTVSPELTVSISLGNNQETLFCAGESVDLTAESSLSNSEYTYTWTPSTGLNVADEAEVEASPSTTTSYIVEVNGGSVCSYFDTLTLTVREEPRFDSVKVIQPFCGAESRVEILAGGNASLEYRINSGNETFGYTENAVFEDIPAGVYDLRIRYTDQPRCTFNSENEFTIEEASGNEAPTLSVSNNRLCAGERLTVSTQAPQDAFLTWDFGPDAIPGMASGEGPHEIQFPTDGVYTIRLTSEIDTCVQTGEAEITVDPSPSISVLPSIPGGLQSGDSVALSLESPVEEAVFSWEMNINGSLVTVPETSGSDPLIQGVFQLEEGETNAQVDIEIFSVANGCADSLSFSFLVSTEPVVELFFAPDLFTPNGDGINDTWSVRFPVGLNPLDHQLLIFNRSGGLIYEGNASQSWNGKNFRNGIASPDGPYWFVIQEKEGSAEAIFSGALSLFR